MVLELHQLDRRYESLRARHAAREKRLLGSLSEIGQQMPIVVVRDGDLFVVVDGYKRLRALEKLGEDTVQAVEWELGESEALLLERLLRSGDADSSIEQGWLLQELSKRFGLSLEELARRFDRSKSWVSRRLALVSELPVAVQSLLRAGTLGAHAAMGWVVLLARPNAEHCVRLAEAVAPLRPTSRQMAELYAVYTAGNAKTRELVVVNPALVLKARAEAEREGPGATPVEHLLDDLRIVSAVARRALVRMRRGALDDADASERRKVQDGCAEAQTEVGHAVRHCERELGDPPDARKETSHDRSVDASSDSALA
jgi:ParB family transcriptional regulator, chromosome partitioning protein